ncbi:MAG: hypothetical protein MCSN_3840 [Candidatus Microsyncoccus archaeolyticus]|nr:MAG: hypothetical protein MCSN_3840 [Candidatus Parcubacteria bacterium]
MYFITITNIISILTISIKKYMKTEGEGINQNNEFVQ